MSEPRETAAARRAALRATSPLRFEPDPTLPISAQRDLIMQALERSQVLIVAGDTGSGKSTQLPQYCLLQDRGIAGLIAHTQPRRLAARSLAARIAEELKQPVGRSVGFRVRFADQASDATRVLLLTDGLLLAELASDPLLLRYDTIIVDEAHERTLNVDLLLGVLKRLLPRRPDLKLIVTSATLDVDRMAQFFDGAPIVTVNGRTHPIEVRYRPPPDETEDPDLPSAVLDAYREIAAEPGAIGNGDTLVFLPGEREIRDVGELLERELQSRVEVLSLYSRLSWEQQSRIFTRGTRPRIVLTTNVAETSITVPGIRSVIDSGLARISRYSARNRLQRLPIERISQASAQQRKGRCGRIGAGLCIRLYTEEDFQRRAPFTEPEVLRTNLAALLLRLAADGLGEAQEFPFLDPPDGRSLNDGYRLLQELKALDEERRITRRGRAMARLPLDPRLASALLESKRFHAQAEVLAIVAGLSVPDPRLADDAAAAAGLEEGRSEFSALVTLWRAYRHARQGPRRELRRWCRERGLSLLRLSEWDDVYSQVADRARELGIVAQRQAASYAAIHRALLAGFCTMVGVRGEDGTYVGTRGVHFHLFPGSPLARRRPRWVMAASIVETSRVFARHVAAIEPKWIESAAAHLLKREFLEPDWDEEREEVIARERIELLGLVLSANRIVNYGPIAPEQSRLIFAREALVYQRLRRRPDWVLANDAALLAAQRLEERLRTRDLLHGAESFVEFYDRALPRQVSSAASLDHFSRRLTPEGRRALALTPERIFARLPDPAALRRFPERARMDSLSIPVEYRFDPGTAQDGAHLQVPLLALPGLTRAAVDAAIPGLAAPRIEALLRSLPKDARRSLIPVAETAAAFLGEAGFDKGDIDSGGVDKEGADKGDGDKVGGAKEGIDKAATGSGAADAEHLTVWLKERRGLPDALLRFDLSAVPAHLFVQITVVADGKPLAQGADLPALRRSCARAAREALDAALHATYGGAGIWLAFAAEELPQRVSVSLEQGTVRVYPSLLWRDRVLAVSYQWSAAEAAQLWREGSVRLSRMLLDVEERELKRQMAGALPLLLRAGHYFSSADLIDWTLQEVFRRACFPAGDAPRTRAAFEAAVELGRRRLPGCLDEFSALAAVWFEDAAAVRRVVDDPRVKALGDAAEETREHLARLFDEPARSQCAQWLTQLPRYIKAEQRRWQRNAARGNEPAHIVPELRRWSARYRDLAAQVAAELRFIPELAELRIGIEEYRISLYAQEIKTLGPISAARLEQRAAAVEQWLRR